MRRYYRVALVLAFLLLASAWLLLASPRSNEAPREGESFVAVSLEQLLQGDTLLVRAYKKPSVQGTFGGEELHFFRSEDGNLQIAVVGIDAKAEPGLREIVLRFEDGEKIRKTVEVVRRNFPVTELKVTETLEASGYTPARIAANLARQENPDLKKIIGVVTPVPHFREAFRHPLAEAAIVGAFGNIRKSGGMSVQHLGVDLDAEEGTPIVAANRGTVAYAGGSVNYGNMVVLDHGLGIYSLYLHLREFAAAPDARVEKGEIIALSGNTGYSLSPHLHFSIKVNGANVDPLRFIETLTRI